jgi:hypothetical protein
VPTAHALRKEAEAAEEKAARLLEYAKVLRIAAAEVEKTQGLRSRHGYATVARMDATDSAPAKAKHRGPAAKSGPMVDAARAAGLATLQDLATAIGETYSNVRTINSRGSVPVAVKAKLDALTKASKQK